MPSFKTTQAMRNAARLGLELRRKFGRGGLTTREAGRQGIGSGVARATAIANGKDIPIETVRRMRAYFARHAVDKRARGWGSRTDRSAGYIAWLLWGGDPGRRWADRIVAAYDKGD